MKFSGHFFHNLPVDEFKQAIIIFRVRQKCLEIFNGVQSSLNTAHSDLLTMADEYLHYSGQIKEG